jgi:hypothetical protein
MTPRDEEAMEVVNEIRHQSFKDAVARSATTHADDCLSRFFRSGALSRLRSENKNHRLVAFFL